MWSRHSKVGGVWGFRILGFLGFRVLGVQGFWGLGGVESLLASDDLVAILAKSIWVVVKIRGPFWVPKTTHIELWRLAARNRGLLARRPRSSIISKIAKALKGSVGIL